MAPEVQKSEIYDIKKADIYSLAIILFIMVYGCPPFEEAVESD